MSHISYSALKIWNECAFKHKLKYIDRVDEFKGNEFTAFGKAIHSTCEKIIISEAVNYENYFETEFLKEITDLKQKEITLKPELINNMRTQGKKIVKDVFPAVKQEFGAFEVISVEEKLFEDIEESDCKFKGFIDLVLKTPDDKYHIIDWKTCSWGWDSRKKTDKMLTYQLVLYKHYFAKKHNIDPKQIETHFALLKRTAKNNNTEIFRVSSGAVKNKNALKLLSKALYNISRKKFIKNRLSCKYCEFYKTEHCT
tara:strand:+ start:5680 stop:6444 length:765 start_codon:yes stop_codon:yes gene_type:complete